MANVKFSKAELETAADDVSQIFETPIPTGVKTTIKKLKNDLIEAATELQADDKITDKTIEILTSLGAKLPEEKPDLDLDKDKKADDEKQESEKQDKKADDEKQESEKQDKKADDEKQESEKQDKKQDEFGFLAGSQNSFFANAIKNTPMTMAEIKKEKWNSKGGTYYSLWKKLLEIGVGQKTKDGKMSIKKNWKK